MDIIGNKGGVEVEDRVQLKDYRTACNFYYFIDSSRRFYYFYSLIVLSINRLLIGNRFLQSGIRDYKKFGGK